MSLRQCAATLLTNPQGQVLLVQQSYGLRLWGFPGGVVDPGETAPEAAVREAREEVGLDMELSGVVGAYRLQGGGWPDILAWVFTARVLGGTPRPDPAELTALGWFAPGARPGPLLPDAEAGLADWTAGRSGVVRPVQRTLSLPPLV